MRFLRDPGVSGKLLKFSETVGVVTRVLPSVLQGITWPYIELALRLWIARLFFSFGVLQLMNWQPFVQQAAEENPIPGLSPMAAAVTSTGIYLACGALLAAGFMTRYAALPLLVLSIITQSLYEPYDTQLFWIVLAGWLCIHGAGPMALDHLLRRGVGDSALPFIPRLIKLSTTVRARISPVYLSLLRLWLATALLVAAFNVNHPFDVSMAARWLPLDVAARIRVGGAWIGGALLLLGAGTRYVAIALLSCLAVFSVVDPRSTDSIYLLMLLSILAVFGGGTLAADRIVQRIHDRFTRSGRVAGAQRLATLPRVVIVGAGFGGLRCAKSLRDAGVGVTLIDRTNYHLFQPLLYQVATAGLSPGDIASPARQMFRNAPAIRLLFGTVTGVDTGRQLVLIGSDQIPYDYLVLATGASHSYFGNEHWAPFAPGLKRVEDALEIRRRILTAFERAEAASSEDERRSLLTFLIVGGGPTGVELAGAIAELARYGLEKDFRSFDPSTARVILVQSAARLLPAFPEGLAKVAQRSLEKLGVEVHLGSRVDEIDQAGVSINGRRLAARTVVWAAGVNASPAAQWLNAASDKSGRMVVDEQLRVPGFGNVFGIGDTVACMGWKGASVPGLAPAAKQAGSYVARQIRAMVENRQPLPPFQYRHFGSLATIGRKAAVADFGVVKLSGAVAWWLWGGIHLGLMLGVRNKLATLVNWFWAYLKFGGSIRLITEN